MEIEKIKVEDLEEFDSHYEEYILKEPEKTIVYKLKNKDIIIRISQTTGWNDFGRTLSDNLTILNAYQNDYKKYCKVIFVDIKTDKLSRDKEKYLPEIQSAWEEFETERIKREKEIEKRREKLKSIGNI